MATTEETKPTTAETGETLPPVTSTEPSKEESPKEGDASAATPATAPAKAKKEKAPKAEKAPKVATAAKGTTGSSTTEADGTPAAQAINSLASAASTVLNSAAAGFTTVTGSDDSTVKVYNGEPPMSPEDRQKAAQGFDPLNIRVPDGAPYGNMGLPHVANKSEAPIGPTGNVPTGAPHADLTTAAKLDAPLQKEREKSQE